MISYEIKSPDLDRLISNLKGATKDTARIVESALDNAGLRLLDAVKTEAPIRTGNLRRSTFVFRSKGSRIIRPGANYAIYVHEGTKRMRANPFLVRAGEKSEATINKILKEAADIIASRI
jgi:HK97 gp10 family phage protein